MYQTRQCQRGFVPDLGKEAPGLAVFAGIDPYKEYKYRRKNRFI